MTQIPNSAATSGQPQQSTVGSRLLASFGVPAYRLLWVSTFFGIMSLLTNILALGWLVLVLTDSPLWVGLAAGLRGAAQVGFGTFGGVLVDRLDKRKVLFWVEVASAAMALTIAFLVLSGRVLLWHVLVGALWHGLVSSMRAPTVNTMVYQVIGSRRYLNAAAAQLLAFNLANIVGSAAVGFLITARGISSGYLYAAGCSFASAFTVLFIRGSYRPGLALEPFWRSVGDGLRYAWSNRPVRRLLTLSVITESFGFSFHVMLPVMARDVLGVGASGLGLLSSAAGVGATLSTLVVASLGDYRYKGALLVGNGLGAGLFLVLFALSRWYLLSLALVTLVGAALMAYDVTMQTLVQLLSSDAVRGRVQGIYTLTFGFTSLGGFVSGVAANVVGAPLAVAAGGGLILAYMLSGIRTLGRLRPMGSEAAQAAD